jgi:hypothetical protein
MPQKRKPTRRVRVRDIPLSEIDETKVALAFWLLAKRLIEEEAAEGESVAP